MAVFTVMMPPPTGDALTDAEHAAFVKDGFSWAAFLFPAIWAIYHGLWLALLLVIVGVAVVGAVVAGLDGRAGVILAVALMAIFAFEASVIRRWTLTRAGWQMAGIVVGRRRDEIERRFFERWTAERGAAATAPEPSSGLHIPPAPEDGDVVGLFPSPERT